MRLNEELALCIVQARLMQASPRPVAPVWLKRACLATQEPSWQKCLQQTADDLKFGMCMAVALFPAAACPHAACAYEDGTVAVWSSGTPDSPVMHARLHNEPVMALVLFEAADGEPCTAKQC